MSPYTIQLIAWFKLVTKKNNEISFLFFNDGNLTPDSSKIIGKTGGLYYKRLSNFKDVSELAIETMLAGFGGDSPENDIEAILQGIKQCPKCNNIILIADNYSNMRDISLLSKIGKPIHIILCRTYGGINVQYLKLAQKTNGSIHTIEQDLSNLAKMNEGEIIKIGNKTYKILNGQFIILYDKKI